jgi:HEAT repeat protein
VRYRAGSALGYFGPGAVPGLVELLHDADDEVRGQALTALRAHGNAARIALLPLVHVVRYDVDPKNRIKAAAALALLGPTATKAVPALMRALSDRSPKVQRAAVRALGVIGPDARAAVPLLCRQLPREDLVNDVVTALARIGPGAVAAVPRLLPLLRIPDEGGPASLAAGALGCIGHGSPEVVTAMARALYHEDWYTRICARDALGCLGEAAVAVLIPKLNDVDVGVRAHAALALGANGRIASPALPALRAMLNDPEEWVRQAAQEAIAAIERRRPLF